MSGPFEDEFTDQELTSQYDAYETEVHFYKNLKSGFGNLKYEKM